MNEIRTIEAVILWIFMLPMFVVWIAGVTLLVVGVMKHIRKNWRLK